MWGEDAAPESLSGEDTSAEMYCEQSSYSEEKAATEKAELSVSYDIMFSHQQWAIPLPGAIILPRSHSKCIFFTRRFMPHYTLCASLICNLIFEICFRY